MKSKMTFLMLMGGILFLLVSSCTKEETPPVNLESAAKPSGSDTNLVKSTGSDKNIVYSPVSDIDGNVYKTVKIGTQTWMAENLKTTRYNDGTAIPFGNGGPAGYTNWFDYGDGNYLWYNGAYCWYDNDSTYKDAYGAIYNWHAVGTGNLCPTGWHVPTNSEWTTLITSLGGTVEAFNETTENAMIYCSNNNINESGFAPVLAGELCGWGFLYNGIFWWSATPRPTERTVPAAYIWSFNIMGFEPQSYGYSVRCLKD